MVGAATAMLVKQAINRTGPEIAEDIRPAVVPGRAREAAEVAAQPLGHRDLEALFGAVEDRRGQPRRDREAWPR